MLPLQIYRLFDSTAAKEQLQPLLQPHHRERISEDAQVSGAEWQQEDRRKNQNRRQQNRREKQQSILLNTRKPQGRRHSAGRRASDLQAPGDYRPISFKG
jgi:hypothetical protein